MECCSLPFLAFTHNLIHFINHPLETMRIALILLCFMFLSTSIQTDLHLKVHHTACSSSGFTSLYSQMHRTLPLFTLQSASTEASSVSIQIITMTLLTLLCIISNEALANCKVSGHL